MEAAVMSSPLAAPMTTTPCLFTCLLTQLSASSQPKQAATYPPPPAHPPHAHPPAFGTRSCSGHIRGAVLSAARRVRHGRYGTVVSCLLFFASSSATRLPKPLSLLPVSLASSSNKARMSERFASREHCVDAFRAGARRASGVARCVDCGCGREPPWRLVMVGWLFGRQVDA
ncbi:hypothetical protein BKA81DRAFT_401963 [Phyllosticta paracitricarpa]|uniref:Uncharacterized protein n=1 Tax=Phyllosticta citricarpa TaxID=55181 RepID=A0ABR1L7E3_9PEZI